MSGIVIDETQPNQPKYINSDGKKFYRSVVPEGSMPLKRKLLIGGSAPKQNKHSDNQGGHKRVKLSDKEKKLLPPQERKVMVADVARGTHRMMTTTEFANLDWGWPIV